MEKSTRNKIILGAAVGVAGLVIWKWKDIQEWAKEKFGTGNGTGGGTDTGEGKGGSTSGDKTGYTQYQLKVMELQELLKVGVDGNPQKQTNGQLDYMWANYGKPLDADKAFLEGYPELKKNGKGVVSEANVQYYIDTLKAVNSPRQLFWKLSGAGQSAYDKGKQKGDEIYLKGAAGNCKVNFIGGNGSQESRYFKTNTGYSASGKKVSIGGNIHLFSVYNKIGYTDSGLMILEDKQAYNDPNRFIIIDPFKLKCY